jgi:hypothetical protein
MIHVYNGKLYTNVVNPKLEYVTDSIFPPYNPYYWITFWEGPKAQFTRVDFRDFSEEINNNYIEINHQQFKYKDIKENLEYIQALIENDVNQEAIETLP